MNYFRPITLTLLTAFLLIVTVASADDVYLPVIINDPTATPLPTPTPTPTPTPIPPATPTPVPTNPSTEFRGLWVSRFDWTVFGRPADPAKIDEIVDNVSLAGFNVIFFQVRGTADAYYTPGLEPWAQRVSGGDFGEWPDPFWDPLAYFIDKAHAKGIQLHAYLNMYPAWDCDSQPSASVLPRPLYHQLIDQYGTTEVGDERWVDGLQSISTFTKQCLGGYQRVSPASIFFDDHLLAVSKDIVNRYDIDGLHLDHIRYGGRNASTDPVSLCRYNGFAENCSPVPEPDISDEFKDWQRRQVNGTVRKFYTEIIADNPDLWLSAAVWPIHTNKWGWAASQGFHDYYQDSKAWVQEGYIDSISPMIYANTTSGCPEDDNSILSTREVWATLVADFQAESGDRYMIPGIGSGFCDFAEIEWRINYARSQGTAGHAMFSYGYLKTRSFFDDFRDGPYSTPATVPDLPWH